MTKSTELELRTIELAVYFLLLKDGIVAVPFKKYRKEIGHKEEL